VCDGFIYCSDGEDETDCHNGCSTMPKERSPTGPVSLFDDVIDKDEQFEEDDDDDLEPIVKKDQGVLIIIPTCATRPKSETLQIKEIQFYQNWLLQVSD